MAFQAKKSFPKDIIDFEVRGSGKIFILKVTQDNGEKYDFGKYRAKFEARRIGNKILQYSETFLQRKAV